jgi:hypothetical protein
LTSFIAPDGSSYSGKIQIFGTAYAVHGQEVWYEMLGVGSDAYQYVYFVSVVGLEFVWKFKIQTPFIPSYGGDDVLAAQPCNNRQTETVYKRNPNATQFQHRGSVTKTIVGSRAPSTDH